MYLDLIEDNELVDFVNENIDKNYNIRQVLSWEETGLSVVHSIDWKKNMVYKL